MTFDQFKSNAEQVEAHRRDFEKFWFVNLSEASGLNKESVWECVLYDAWLDLVVPEHLK